MTPPRNHGRHIFFLEIEIVTTKIVNSKSLKKICRQLLSTMNVLKNTALNTDNFSLLCASTYCLTAPEDRYNYGKALYISMDTSFLRPHIFLPLYWQSLPPILLFTPGSTPTIISLQDIHILVPGVKFRFFLQKIVLERIANFKQVLWDSFVRHLLLWKQFIEDTPIDKISHRFIYMNFTTHFRSREIHLGGYYSIIKHAHEMQRKVAPK